MCCATKDIIFWVERPLISSTLLEDDPHFLSKKERAKRRVEKMKARSVQDINALEAQQIKAAFFFNRKLFEWEKFINVCVPNSKSREFNCQGKCRWVFCYF